MECKICNRTFANGKALGGHMRSHFAMLPLPPKTHQLTEPLAESSGSSVVCDEAESSATGSRCKRQKGGDDEMSVEEVALCLVMLSRDDREKINKCGMCERVFKSAQGLGSHRSNHHKRLESKLDLNLPPPQNLDEDDDGGGDDI